MDTIQFKVWDKKEKKFLPREEYVFKSIAIDMKGNMIWEEQECNDRLEAVFLTGLKDKKGKDICLGDIVLIPDHWAYGKDSTHIVKWDDDCGYIFPFGVCDWGQAVEPREIEVIGNIYENPELLKEEKWTK